MRLTTACLSVLLLAAACGRETDEAAPELNVSEVKEAPVSDELPGLPGAATGIAFWDHPTLSFSSTMVVTTEAGVVSYNMEDGNEVARIDGFNADGVAAGYLGFGVQAAGFIAFFDADENVFRFYGVDNNTRAFLPLDAGPAIRGAVRGFCMGRAASSPTPSLFVVQNSKIQVFNLAGSERGVTIESEATLETPDNLVSCAVDLDGQLIVAARNGDIFRLTGDDAFGTPFVQTTAQNPGDIAIISAANPEDLSDVSGELILADHDTGALHVFDLKTGKAYGSVKITPTDDLPGVDNGDVFTASGGNLGGLYRNGVAAFGVTTTESGPAIRLTPTNSIKNALSIPVGDPVSPRGQAPEIEDTGLIIKPSFTPQ